MAWTEGCTLFDYFVAVFMSCRGSPEHYSLPSTESLPWQRSYYKRDGNPHETSEQASRQMARPTPCHGNKPYRCFRGSAATVPMACHDISTACHTATCGIPHGMTPHVMACRGSPRRLPRHSTERRPRQAPRKSLRDPTARPTENDKAHDTLR